MNFHLGSQPFLHFHNGPDRDLPPSPRIADGERADLRDGSRPAPPQFLGASGDNTTGKLTLTHNAADGPATETFTDDATIDATKRPTGDAAN